MKEAIDTNPVDKSPDQPVNSKLPSFDKDFWLLRNTKANIPGILRIAFTWNTLDDYLFDLWKWLQAAIGNEKGAYEKGARRIGLMKFYDALLPLLEALNAINETGKIIEQSGDEKQRSLAESDLAVPPKIAIQEFCRSFSWDYCRMELWDWLDSAISSDEFYTVGLDRSFLLIQYQCIYSLIEAAYLLCTQYEGQVLQSNNPEITESKPGGEALIIIRHFFLNTPLQKATSIMQEFYAAWVHGMAEVAAPNEHSEKLLYYEHVTQFFCVLHDLSAPPTENDNKQFKK